MKKMNKKGFTLAELLIVVAIIAVLVAVAIPVFNNQLEKSRKAVDEANCRSAYGEAMATYLTDTETTNGSITLAGVSYTWEYADDTMTVGTTSEGKSTTYASGISYNGTEFTAGGSSGGEGAGG